MSIKKISLYFCFMVILILAVSVSCSQEKSYNFTRTVNIEVNNQTDFEVNLATARFSMKPLTGITQSYIEIVSSGKSTSSTKYDISVNQYENKVELNEVKVPQDCGWNIVYEQKLECTVYLAVNMIKNLDIINVSGNIDLYDINPAYIDINNGSGNSNFYGNLADFHLRTESGSINIRTKTLPLSFNMEVVSGNSAITFPENSGFVLNYQLLSGLISSDFFIFPDKEGTIVYPVGSAVLQPVFSMKAITGNIMLYKATVNGT